MNKSFLRISMLAPIVALLSGCAGYKVGPVTPKYMAGINSLAVPTFRNDTLLPRVEVPVTNTVIKQIQQDGTFRIERPNTADAVLEGKIVAVDRVPTRSVRDNVRATREFRLRLTISYAVINPNTNETITSGNVTGETSFFVGNDVNQEERIAIPRAAEQAAIRLVSEISEGW